MNLIDYHAEKLCEHFNKNLSGSGFNYKWDVANDSKKIYLSSSFACMTDHGFYDGCQDFQVVLPLKDIVDFKLQFTGYRRKNYISLLRDYIEESVHYCIEQYVEGLEK